MMKNTKATYKKLRDGSWGVFVTGPVRDGSCVEVVKRDGSINRERVEKVLWSNENDSICKIYKTTRRYADVNGNHRKDAQNCR